MSTKRSPVPVASAPRAKASLARYANHFDIGHNRYEFLIDFGQFDPDTARVTVHTRMVIGPVQAKLLSEMLSGSVRSYERRCGPIVVPGAGAGADPMASVLRTLPDFAQRAVAARRRSAPKT